MYFAVRPRISSFWNRLRHNSVLKAVPSDMSSPIFKYWRSIHRDANRKDKKYFIKIYLPNFYVTQIFEPVT